MIVTEEEAKTKRCQESFGDTALTSSGYMVPGAVPLYTAIAPVQTSPIMCIGSACMAWRWQRTEDGLPATDEFLGYCGKAGLP